MARTSGCPASRKAAKPPMLNPVMAIRGSPTIARAISRARFHISSIRCGLLMSARSIVCGAIVTKLSNRGRGYGGGGCHRACWPAGMAKESLRSKRLCQLLRSGRRVALIAWGERLADPMEEQEHSWWRGAVRRHGYEE